MGLFIHARLMRSLRTVFVFLILAGAFGAGLPNVWSAGFSLFRNVWGDVIVATDTTPEGHAMVPPTPANPVYYLGQSLGCRLGSIPGDQLPAEREMTRFIAK